MTVKKKTRQFVAKDLYDALTGRFFREVKPNDIVQLSTLPTATGVADAVLGSTITTSANQNLYITAFSVGRPAGAGNFGAYILAGSSTILPVTLASQGWVDVVATHDAPLYKVPVSTNVTMRALTAGTYTAFLSGYREPAITSVEI